LRAGQAPGAVPYGADLNPAERSRGVSEERKLNRSGSAFNLVPDAGQLDSGELLGGVAAQGDIESGNIGVLHQEQSESQTRYVPFRPDELDRDEQGQLERSRAWPGSRFFDGRGERDCGSERRQGRHDK
jgi:hypothetical protein